LIKTAPFRVRLLGGEKVSSFHFEAKNFIIAILSGLFFYLFLSALQRILCKIVPIKKVGLPLNFLFLLLALLLIYSIHPWPLSPKVLLSFQALLIFLIAYLLIRLLDFLIADLFLILHRKVQIPLLLRDIIRWILIFVTFLVVLNKMLGINLTPLIATSAVLTLVISFALQDTLSNLFAGIALNLEKPFEIGDFVSIGNHTGTVMDITWRATRIRTFENDCIIIPNGSLAKESIRNYSAPTKMHGRSFRLGVSYLAPPNKVKEVIFNSLRETPGVLPEPKPVIRLVEYSDFAIIYEIRFWIGDFKDSAKIQDDAVTRIWYQLRRNGL